MSEVAIGGTTWITLVGETCCVCGIAFGLGEDYQRQRRDDQKSWYCPNGHHQHYTGPTEAQKLRDQLEEQKRRTESEREWRHAAERSVVAQRAQATRARNERDRIKTRVSNGACPCCKRSFSDLRRHMQCKHPGWRAQE